MWAGFDCPEYADFQVSARDGEVNDQFCGGHLVDGIKHVIEDGHDEVTVRRMPAETGAVAVLQIPCIWYHGPTDTDPDPGKRWCKHCGGEVWSFDGGYICSGCNRTCDC